MANSDKSPKKRFSVSVPFTGYVVIEVDADDEESAIAAALMSEDLDFKNAEEVEFHKRVVRGNVCSAVLSEAEAMEIEQDPDSEEGGG